LHQIGRAIGKEHSSVRWLVSRYGGFVPAVRRRSSLLEIAIGLERTVSTRKPGNHTAGWPFCVPRQPSRRRNLGVSALPPKRCLLAIHGKLRKIVASKLILDWSPQQISGWPYSLETNPDTISRVVVGTYQGSKAFRGSTTKKTGNSARG